MTATKQVVIDQEICQGHGKCYLFVPEVFAVADDYGHGKAFTSPDDEDTTLKTRVDNAIRNCPEDAIRWRPRNSTNEADARDSQGARP
jgi:ferredoxin